MSNTTANLADRLTELYAHKGYEYRQNLLEEDDNRKIWHEVVEVSSGKVVGMIDHSPYSTPTVGQFHDEVERIIQHKAEVEAENVAAGLNANGSPKVTPAPAVVPKMVFKTKAQRQEWLRQKLATDPAWAIRALKAIYKQQTENERQDASTHDENGVGFSGNDAEILSSFAERVLAWEATAPANRLYASPLSPRQMEVLLKRIKRYAGQLLALYGAKFDAQYPIIKG
jgi:hypothetical protein